MLTPQVNTELVEDSLEEEGQSYPTASTWFIDFKNGRITSEKVDGNEGVKQFVKKVLMTDRYRYLIYDDSVGSELYNLIGYSHSIDYLNSEIPRIVRDCLSVDDRIVSVDNFYIEKQSDKVIAKFKVNTIYEDSIYEEVAFNV